MKIVAIVPVFSEVPSRFDMVSPVYGMPIKPRMTALRARQLLVGCGHTADERAA